MTAHTTALDDQLIAAARETEAQHAAAAAAVSDAGRGHATTDHHPLEGQFVSHLAIALTSRAVVLCEHTWRSGPQPVWWSPGHGVIGCRESWRTTRHQLHHIHPVHPVRCNACSTGVEAGTGQVMFTAGPVTLVVTLCPACVERPYEPMTAQTQRLAAGGMPLPEVQHNQLLEAVRELVDALQTVYAAPPPGGPVPPSHDDGHDSGPADERPDSDGR